MQEGAPDSAILASFGGLFYVPDRALWADSGSVTCWAATAPCRKSRKAMIDKHLQADRRSRARKKCKMLCLQELFYGPYFCAEQDIRWYDLTERVPDGPTTKLMQKLAAKHRMVIVVPVYEEQMPGLVLQYCCRHRCRRQIPGQISQAPHPACASRILGEVLFHAGRSGLSRIRQRSMRASECISAMTVIFRKVRACSASTARRLFSIPRRRSRGCRNICGNSSSPRTPPPTAILWARSIAWAGKALEHRRVLRQELFLQSARQDLCPSQPR